MFAKFLLVVGILASIGLSYVLTSTAPAQAGAVAVLAVFLLSYIVSVVVLTFFIFLSHQLLRRLLYSDRTGYASDRVSMRKSYYYASIVALAPVLLVGLRSVGRGGALELALVLILLAIGCLYVSRQTS